MKTDLHTQYLYAAWIAEKYRGQHFFTKLLMYVERELHFLSCTKVFLGVDAEDTNLINMYKHLGFIKELGFSENRGNENILYLEKELG